MDVDLDENGEVIEERTGGLIGYSGPCSKREWCGTDKAHKYTRQAVCSTFIDLHARQHAGDTLPMMCEQVGLARDAYDLLVEKRLSLSIGRIQRHSSVSVFVLIPPAPSISKSDGPYQSELHLLHDFRSQQANLQALIAQRRKRKMHLSTIPIYQQYNKVYSSQITPSVTASPRFRTLYLEPSTCRKGLSAVHVLNLYASRNLCGSLRWLEGDELTKAQAFLEL